MCPMHNAEVFGLVLGIIGAGLRAEDGATVTAATFAATCLLDIRLAFVSAFCGLWIGDLGVYALARNAGPSVERNRWFARLFKFSSKRNDPPSRQAWELALSRFVPGTRLPAYLAAGLSRMPASWFSTITATTALLWTLLVFLLIRLPPAARNDTAKQLRS